MSTWRSPTAGSVMAMLIANSVPASADPKGFVAGEFHRGSLYETFDQGAAFVDPGNGVPVTADNSSDQEVVLYAGLLGVVETPVMAAEHPDGCDL